MLCRRGIDHANECSRNLYALYTAPVDRCCKPDNVQAYAATDGNNLAVLAS